MKKIISVLLVLIMITAGACSCGSSDKKTATIYTDISGGNQSDTVQFVKEHSYEYSGELTVEKLAGALTEITGLKFTVSSEKVSDGIKIDWSSSSSLIAGPGDVQKPEYFFYESTSLMWFMLDSLYKTVTENLGIEKVYYSVNGEASYVNPDLYYISELPADSEYMGSVFYKAHSDVKGDDDAADGDVSWWGDYSSGGNFLSIPTYRINEEGDGWFLFGFTTADGKTFEGTAGEYASGQATYMDLNFALNGDTLVVSIDTGYGYELDEDHTPFTGEYIRAVS